MKGDELSVQVPFMRVRHGLQVAFQPPGQEDGQIGPPTPLALCLARAHALDQTLEAWGPGALGVLAGRLGVSRPRLAQIHALVYLVPDLQEAVLLSRLEASRVNFHALLRIARMPVWQDQREAWRELVGKQPSASESHPGQRSVGRNTRAGSRAPQASENPRTHSRNRREPSSQRKGDEGPRMNPKR